MSTSERNKTFDHLFDQILRSSDLKSSKSLKRFALLHQSSNSIEISNIALHEQDSDLRQVAVEKLEDEDILFHVAKTDKDIQIKSIAITKICDKKKLAFLRLTSEMELQPYIYAQISKIRDLDLS